MSSQLRHSTRNQDKVKAQFTVKQANIEKIQLLVLLHSNCQERGAPCMMWPGGKWAFGADMHVGHGQSLSSDCDRCARAVATAAATSSWISRWPASSIRGQSSLLACVVGVSNIADDRELQYQPSKEIPRISLAAATANIPAEILACTPVWYLSVCLCVCALCISQKW